ncbi:DUF402 domain-containing protein [Mollicutes bacterium LVI A0078]|nr:DUF402 domain-containing protein [Mollicutes bacterium LVI A0075]WOO90921.1 DUF402 domain-containing protein [Mollicutes bacterium LVI A0078]
MEKIGHYAYKYDGSFHRYWQDALKLAETRDYIITATPKRTNVIEGDGYFWRSRELAINYFSKDKWFNVIIMYKDDEIVYYCNLASPCLIEAQSIKYIDYDLDVKYFPKSKQIKVLDRNEFNNNIETYGYPQQIIDIIEKQMTEIQFLMENEIGPFDPEFALKWKRYYIDNK